MANKDFLNIRRISSFQIILYILLENQSQCLQDTLIVE